MAEGVVLFYGFLVSFVIASTKSNRKALRPHPTVLLCVGWLLMSLSFSTSAMLAGRALILSLS
ncbi:MAG TPA: hypothetical protein VF649_04085 [Sphingomonas sp.]|jgi:hypothetical protein|uniref:hypothetical protein n=1 Tax=Sphingomonas sp. TaxID=28214 RepID=UPI002ED85FCE